MTEDKKASTILPKNFDLENEARENKIWGGDTNKLIAEQKTRKEESRQRAREAENKGLKAYNPSHKK